MPRSARSTRRPTPSPSSRHRQLCEAVRDHGGPRRQHLVHRHGDDEIGMINPTTDAISRLHHSHRHSEPMGSRRAPTATSGSPSRTVGKIGKINPTTDAITEYPIPYAGSSRRDHGGPRRQPLVHRYRHQRDRRRHPDHIATGGDAAAAGQRHRGQPLRPDGRGRGQLGQPRSPRSTAR